MLNRERLLDALLLLIRHRKMLLVNFLVVSASAVVYSLILDVEYQSSLTFLPPAQSSLGGISGLISGIPAGGLQRNDITTQQLMTILNSRALRERVIAELDLISHYELEKNKNKRFFALERLSKDLMVHAEQNLSLQGSSTYSITLQTVHTSPDTAFIMANFVFGLLDSAVNAVNSSNARRTREFVERRLVVEQKELDSLQQSFQAFQRANQFYDVGHQAKLVIGSISDIRSQVVTLEIQRDLLLHERTSSNPSVRKLNREIATLNAKLEQIKNRKTPDLLTSLDLMPELGAQFGQFMMEIQVKTQVILFLSQQLEHERVIENRNISYLSVIDPPVVAEYKFRPKRAFVVLGIVVPECLLLVLLILFRSFYRNRLRDSDDFHRVKNAFARK